MAITKFSITPFIPCDNELAQSVLPDKAMELTVLSAKLSGQLSDITMATLARYMRVINSYYSNLIEGNATKPHEIRAAQSGGYSEDPAKRDLQQESLGHMNVQKWLYEQNPDLDTLFNTDFIKAVHEKFYQNIPESLWDIKNELGKVVERVVPGEFRKTAVAVGQHIAPKPADLNLLMSQFCEIYKQNTFNGDRKLIAVMAAHHRFSWIHPFIDGNGRVGRLLTDAALRAIGLDSCSVWCLSRGLARSSSQYKGFLARADIARQSDLDGRGALTEKGLVEFCEYMLNIGIDQVEYMSSLLDVNNFQKRLKGYIQAREDGRIAGFSGSLKPVAATLLYTAFIQGELSRAQAIELTGLEERTARRLIAQLKQEGLLSEKNNKSPLKWEVPEHIEPWYFPELSN